MHIRPNTMTDIILAQSEKRSGKRTESGDVEMTDSVVFIICMTIVLVVMLTHSE
ncbi:MAG: hypothetical protein IJ158_09320 [Treponema sp.]|nr:hypothetical protein [Treponema sp.]